jgi:hypothetical protein
MLSRLSVKRQWFLTADARRRFPMLTSATGTVLDDADTGRTVRVRVAGRSVAIEDTRAASCGGFCAADVDDKFRSKATKARRVSIEHDLPSDMFDPSRAHVPAECMLGAEHSYDSSCVVQLEAAEAAEAVEAVEAAEDNRAALERLERERLGRLEREESDARVLELVKQLFDKALCVSRHVPVIRLPLASVTFQYLCEAAPSRAVLERLGERYLATLQSALRQSDGARELYAARCIGAGPELRKAVLDGTWE